MRKNGIIKVNRQRIYRRISGKIKQGKKKNKKQKKLIEVESSLKKTKVKVYSTVIIGCPQLFSIE